ncbi:hypothetical protein QR680_007820 [Steinernema hermaphroditum]|uniref:Uncharacterized protein n=1 Tax=Steinernema hermaphroditum TaxID=289476 RepID=A0AA39IEC0_9BILA|nr:hypothetical protein QR680_007820 [Steinernema hermaphroditum]
MEALVAMIFSTMFVHALMTGLTIVPAIVSCKTRGDTNAADKAPTPKGKGAFEAVSAKDIAKSKKGRADSTKEPKKLTKAEKFDACPSTDLETLECFKGKDKGLPKDLKDKDKELPKESKDKDMGLPKDLKDKDKELPKDSNDKDKGLPKDFKDTDKGLPKTNCDEKLKDAKPKPSEGNKNNAPDNVGDAPKVVLSQRAPVGNDKKIQKDGGICVDKDGNVLSTFAAPK